VAADGAHTLSWDVPDIVTLVGFRVALRPAGTLLAVNWTVPEKPPWAVIVMVAVLHWPWTTFIGPLLVMAKSWTFTVTIVECERTAVVPVIDGVVPVTVTVNVPPLPVDMHVRVLVPEPPDIVDGLTLQLSPVDGDTEVDRVTVPVKPFTGDTMMLVDPVPPGVVLIIVGLAKIWKSTTWTFIVGVV